MDITLYLLLSLVLHIVMFIVGYYIGDNVSDTHHLRIHRKTLRQLSETETELELLKATQKQLDVFNDLNLDLDLVGLEDDPEFDLSQLTLPDIDPPQNTPKKTAKKKAVDKKKHPKKKK